jgi:hypothetical protein
VTNRSDWRRELYGIRKEKRGYIKLHLSVDTKTKRILAFEVTDERTAIQRSSRR